jgi:hypothetical protein
VNLAWASDSRTTHVVAWPKRSCLDRYVGGFPLMMRWVWRGEISLVVDLG